MEIHTSSDVSLIPLKIIELVDRPLSQVVASKIQSSTKHGYFLVIDYKQEASIGYGNVLFSLVIAGRKEDVSTLKYFLLSLLGSGSDPVVGNFRAEELLLLFLFSAKINNADAILPLFDGDSVLLQKTYDDLKKNGMVDEYASLTSSGMDIVEKIKGSDKKRTGFDVDSKFDEFSSNWLSADEHPTIPEANKILWKQGNSSLSGFVATEDLWKYLDIKKISKVELRKITGTGLGLLVHTFDRATIFLVSNDSSIVLALYGILNKGEDSQIRILFTFYLGYESNRDVVEYLELGEYEIGQHCSQLAQKGIMDEQCKGITRKGLDLIYKKLIGDVSVLLENDPVKDNLGEFDRLDQMKKLSAKKRVMEALQNKYMQLENTA
ncbi:MAG: hypothetical protein SCH66_11070 [Methanolobus sp.]|nr:hypothetical protein [Methanolobus sp.]